MSRSRRQFLQSAGALAAGFCMLPSGVLATPLGASGRLAAGPRVARRGKQQLVIVFLRGGIDGLNLVVPHGEDAYYSMRPQIAIQRPGQANGALDLNGFFGLHPAAQPLLPWFQNGSAVAMHAVGYANNTRSHFEEQDTWETGIVGNTLRSEGWVNRHLATCEGHGPIRAIAVGNNLPRILRGQEQTLAIRGLSDLSLGRRGRNSEAAEAALAKAYGKSPMPESNAMAPTDTAGLLAQGGQATLDALRELQSVANADYTPKAEYPQNALSQRFREVARLLKANIGLEVAEIDYGGWDTHQNQGGAQGQYANRLGILAQSLNAFMQDLGDQMENVLVITLSEFGRTAAQNGTNGTDHGWGNALLAFGGAVRAASKDAPRHVLGDWPGLEREQLNQQRDLRHTTDFRDVCAELVGKHLGNPEIGKVIPGRAHQAVGLI